MLIKQNPSKTEINHAFGIILLKMLVGREKSCGSNSLKHANNNKYANTMMVEFYNELQ